VFFCNGMMRCLRPLPTHSSWLCGPIWMLSIRSPMSSLTRSPVWMPRCSRSRSRRPIQVLLSGAAMSASASGPVRNDTSVLFVRFAGIARTWLIVAIESRGPVAGVGEERPQRRPAGVAGGDGVPAVGLQVLEEPADEVGIQVGQRQLGWGDSGRSLGIEQQQPERVGVGGFGVDAGVHVPVELVGEEALQQRREVTHDRPRLGAAARRGPRQVREYSTGTSRSSPG